MEQSLNDELQTETKSLISYLERVIDELDERIEEAE